MSSGISKHVSAPRLGGPYAWLVWSLAAIAFGYAFFHRVTPSVMVSDLMTEFAIGGAMLGTLSALYFYPYFLLQVPLGGMLEVFGTRRLLSLALLLAGIGSFLFGTAHSLEVAYLGRILIGVGSSVGFLGSLALASKWFPANWFAFLAGLAMFIGMASGMAAQAPLAFFIDLYGWRSSLLALGIFGFLLAALVFLFVRNAPAKTAALKDAAADTASPSVSAKWSDLFASLRLAMVNARAPLRSLRLQMMNILTLKIKLTLPRRRKVHRIPLSSSASLAMSMMTPPSQVQARHMRLQPIAGDR